MDKCLLSQRPVIMILILWGFSLLMGCEQGDTSTQAPPPPMVEVVTVTTQTVTDEPEFIG